MNILNILSELEKVDAERYEHLSPRRSAMKDFFHWAKKVTLVSLPLNAGNLFGQAFGQSTSNSSVDALNLLLTVEYLSFNFYQNALVKTPALIPDSAKPVFNIIQEQEQAHINLLIKKIQSLGGTPRAAMPYEAFDYTKVNVNVNTNYATFLRTAMTIEDFSVRVYKGQAIVLLAEKTVLQSVVQIHTIQARHSAQLRKMVYDQQIANLKNLRPWPSNRKTDAGVVDDTNYNDSTVGTVSAVYFRDDATLANAENKIIQSGQQLTGLNGFKEITPSAAAESFDEYLQTATVKTIANTIYLKDGYKFG
ncbi:Ferritin-like domain-containing protein [Pedobacter steynii]|uniref:Ferritin-like domain-containing protein n=1 Tax=Pedobacter steynii TaxID=430522 RepID=A0A1G9JNG5_9SPHI|nr:ferritin-like domain-containing protein [Pedobacter steynii]NQX38308.1 ferritin-like domain-containing protein [Pedobacter steynii]SDL39078.1 Ferritin-like domain-containing protein [Pedobacter steynii]